MVKRGVKKRIKVSNEVYTRIYPRITYYFLIFFFLLLIIHFTIFTNGDTVYLEDIDSGTTSPTGDYRWLDIANQSYCDSYKINYNYTQAQVEVNFSNSDETFHGILISTNLKPNFVYQVKLVGYPGTNANERIGLSGRWWQEEWNGTSWVNGHNLNNKGNGSSPNPNDDLYFARKNISDGTSPTGLKYKFVGYLVIDYFITDGYGNATLDFEANSSYHVLWKTTQRSHTADDGPIKTSTFDVNMSLLAYDFDYPEQTADVFGEWERLPVHGVFLNPGDYLCQFVLTEESFHGDGGVDAGNWAGAMGKDVSFDIADVYIPEITNVQLINETPLDTDSSFGWINISCIATDNVGIDDISLNLTMPDDTFQNLSMDNIPPFKYYYNSTTLFSQYGTYYYQIWAVDTNNIKNASSIYGFTVPPNWDINSDGISNGLDVTWMSIYWMNNGDPGWIRVDINNDGEVNGLDVTFISIHWLETWS